MSLFDGKAVEPIEDLTGATPFRMRAPCSRCSSTSFAGLRLDKGGNSCIYCASCRTLSYNAPRSETGNPERRVLEARNGVSPGLRLKVLERAGFQCEMCHATDAALQAGHILSVKNGLELGLSPGEINREDNLAAMCEACNLTLSEHSLNARQLALLIRNRTIQLDSRRDHVNGGRPLAHAARGGA